MANLLQNMSNEQEVELTQTEKQYDGRAIQRYTVPDAITNNYTLKHGRSKHIRKTSVS
jgi:hypothetical protein